MNKKFWFSLLAFYAFLGPGSYTQADPVNQRHGVFLQDTNEVDVDIGLVAISQNAVEQDINAEFSMSMDAIIASKRGNNIWTLYVEGSNSMNDDTVATVLTETNADAGSALDSNGDGHLQVSELHYTYQQSAYTMVTGLIDVTGFMDISTVANDESRQFLNCHLVNNPSIEFPDYALGFAYHYDSLNNQPGISIILASSHGLADNADASYSEMVDIDAEGKGQFVATEVYQTSKHITVRGGLWINSADHDTFTTNKTDASNYGWYGTTDIKLGNGMLNLRMGQANDEVSKMAGFISAAYLWSSGFNKAGFGMTYGKVSDKLQRLDSSLDNQYQFEAYSRFHIDKHWHITPSLQWIHNSGFDHSETAFDSDVIVAGIRLSWVY